jgi:hypothetical protein
MLCADYKTWIRHSDLSPEMKLFTTKDDFNLEGLPHVIAEVRVTVRCARVSSCMHVLARVAHTICASWLVCMHVQLKGENLLHRLSTFPRPVRFLCPKATIDRLRRELNGPNFSVRSA